ncbi:MAG TPA: hypothetical protein DIT67_07645 [Octadecabacter sp.]|nr:hypothetical protein [Octadecabacter sp.]
MTQSTALSSHPLYRRQKKVQKELNELLVSEGYMSLFPPVVRTGVAKKRWDKRKARIVQQATEFGFDVPQALVDSVTTPT